MSHLLLFILIGSATGVIVEATFNLFITHNYGNFLFTLLFYPLYLLGFYYLQRLILSKIARSDSALFILTYGIGGCLGLAIEWFIIGNSPWGNPNAIQWGMWAFWAAIVSVPTLYLRDRMRGKRLLYTLLLLYGGVSLLAWLLLPPTFHLYALTIWQTVFYTYLHLPYLSYLRSHITRR